MSLFNTGTLVLHRFIQMCIRDRCVTCPFSTRTTECSISVDVRSWRTTSQLSPNCLASAFANCLKNGRLSVIKLCLLPANMIKMNINIIIIYQFLLKIARDKTKKFLEATIFLLCWFSRRRDVEGTVSHRDTGRDYALSLIQISDNSSDFWSDRNIRIQSAGWVSVRTTGDFSEISCADSGYMAVSYTHLDVYKRQQVRLIVLHWMWEAVPVQSTM